MARRETTRQSSNHAQALVGGVLAVVGAGSIASLDLVPSSRRAGMVRALAKPDDYLIRAGTDTITDWAYALSGELAAAR